MGNYIQILLAISLVIIFFVVGFVVYNYEFIKSLRSTGIVKERVEIFSGIKDLSTTDSEVYDTTNKSVASYRNISASFNQDSGTEFTYNFWLYMDKGALYTNLVPTDNTLTADAGYTLSNIDRQSILFSKGSMLLSTYENICGQPKKDIMIKCPLVKLEENGKNLTVEFNTLQGTEAVKENSPNVCTEQSSDWVLANAHKITLRDLDKPELDKRWNMITVVIEDTSPIDPIPYRYKVRCRIYVNGLQELDKYVDGRLVANVSGPFLKGEYSTIKTNNGHLYVAPKLSIVNGEETKSTTLPLANATNQLMLADLTYFNYALTQKEIDIEQAKGVSDKVAPIPGQSMDLSNLTSVTAQKSRKKQLIA